MFTGFYLYQNNRPRVKEKREPANFLCVFSNFVIKCGYDKNTTEFGGY